MDNDDYRRGRLTNHKVYGEGIAILAGDALLNYAFELMLEDTLKSGLNMADKVEAMQYIAKSSGVAGMIGGQIVDMESEGKKISVDTLKYMHKCKTGALLKAPIISAAIICGANEGEINNLTTFAEKIGLSFQIKDDILDVEGDLETMGKNCGSDAFNEKTTYVTAYGVTGAKKILQEVTNEAINAVGSFGTKADFLKSLAEYIANRKN
ncbi:MAG: polyprenyl synthetase family protein, partial [Bacillota bacterium]|nr:polyprenyl synthetase family protein [Bacillota bacterium]